MQSLFLSAKATVTTNHRNVLFSNLALLKNVALVIVKLPEGHCHMVLCNKEWTCDLWVGEPLSQDTNFSTATTSNNSNSNKIASGQNTSKYSYI